MMKKVCCWTSLVVTTVLGLVASEYISSYTESLIVVGAVISSFIFGVTLRGGE